MRSISITLLALAATTPISALDFLPRASSCPSVWKELSEVMISEFAGCGRSAHGAIRAPFHDCINNGCDGSLITTDECSRGENAGLTQTCDQLNEWRHTYNVGAADIIQFAAAIAISACPLGPRVQALVGRKDGSSAAANGQVPSSRDPPAQILAAFNRIGFGDEEVIALLGTHSVAVQVFDDPKQAGKSLDSTPSKYDTLFYKETKEGTAPYSLQSDRALANYSSTAAVWTEFGNSPDLWSSTFLHAWNKFAVVGNDKSSLQDCSSLIPHSSVSKARREANARFRQRLSAKFRAA